MTSNAVCLLLAWIADAADDTEEVQPHHGLLMIQLLEYSREQVGSSEGGSNGGAQS